jgi:hypothetical protein
MIRENGGWESFQMLEIKKNPCNDSNEARAEEERCRVELKATMNTRKAFSVLTAREHKDLYCKENADKIKIWRNKTYDCECGCKVKTYNKARHNRSDIHKSTGNI